MTDPTGSTASPDPYSPPGGQPTTSGSAGATAYGSPPPGQGQPASPYGQQPYSAPQTGAYAQHGAQNPQYGSPQYGSPPYANPQYGAQQYGAQQPAYGAPQQPPYGGHSPYQPAQPGAYQAGGQGHPQQYGYPQGPTVPQERSKALGLIGLAIVVVTGVIAIVMAYAAGGVLTQLAQLAQESGGPLDQTDPRAIALVESNQWLSLFGPVSLVGFIGFILSIVAAATRRGRSYGVWGIILGIVLPIVAFGVAVAAVAARIQ